MANAGSPLLGYNTNVRHKGKLYHIQTEDSGINHPHIITHLFADGGRIIASKKTSYAEYVGTEDYKSTVKKLMQEQHKAMFIALRDGVYDEDEPGAQTAPTTSTRPGTQKAPEGSGRPQAPQPAQASPSRQPQPSARPQARSTQPDPRSTQPGVDVEALERAAQKFDQSSSVAAVPQGMSDAPAQRERHDTERAPKPDPTQGPGRYQSTQSAKGPAKQSGQEQRPSPESQSIFGNDLLSEKSLDEVILSYLAEDLEDSDSEE